MTRVRIDLAYDGTPFHGFARQPDPGLPTVQGAIEDACARLIGVDIPTVGAGRTDAGVHALAQVVHADLPPRLRRAQRFLADLTLTRSRLDSLVGPAITVWRVAPVDDDFDARFSATERGYRYRLIDAPVADPRLRSLRWHVPVRLDVNAMEAAGRRLLGEHDFAAFCRKAPGKHTVRRIDALGVVRNGDEVHIALRGPAFCHQQVRSITGCLVEIGRGRRDQTWLGDVLEARDRARAAPVAPAMGLTLEHIAYPDPYEDAPAPPHAG